MTGKIETDLAGVRPADKTSLKQQIEQAKEKINQVANEVTADKSVGKNLS
jgi:hypothetical protein